MKQWYCLIGNERYGPATKEQLRQWLAEGRITAKDCVWCEGMAEWAPISSIPELWGSTGPAEASPPPLSVNNVSGYTPGGHLEPHRGVTVLVLGILGLVLCPILGIIAWSMGNTDLRKIDAGQMDPTGHSNTNAGKILGMISVILLLVQLGFGLLFLCIGIASSNF